MYPVRRRLRPDILPGQGLLYSQTNLFRDTRDLEDSYRSPGCFNRIIGFITLTGGRRYEARNMS